MTVIFSKKCEYGIQAILYLAAHNDKGLIVSEEIANNLNIPKEFVSKILQSLTDSGIIYSKKGRVGGFTLGKNPDQITLLDIVEAIDGLDVFNSCVLGFPECSPEKPCPLHDQWGKLRSQAYNMLADETIDTFRQKTLDKISKK